MAVIISDMEFPKRCLDCQLMGREKMYCQLHPRKDLNVVRVVSEKPEWCPLKEVPTGKWIDDPIDKMSKDFGYIQFYCSNCNHTIKGIGVKYTDYCPRCGADMRG